MSKRVLILALAAAGAACSTPRSAGPAGNGRTLVVPLALEPPPVYALIGYRDRLELTSQQVTALDSIAVAVREENGALIDQLEEKAITTNRAPGVLQVNPTERPLLDQIRANNRRVLDQVSGVLTTEQRTEVCELYEPERPQGQRQSRRRRDPQDEFRDERRTAQAPDTSAVVRGFSVWPWCSTPDEGRDTTANR